MTTDILTVCAAIALNIRTVLNSDTISGRTYSIAPDATDPPTAVVVPGPGEFIVYDDTFTGTQTFDILVKLLLGTQDAPSAQKRLLGYLKKTGPTSIRAAILSDQTLGGICSFIEVPYAQNLHNVEWAGQLQLGAELVVKVFE